MSPRSSLLCALVAVLAACDGSGSPRSLTPSCEIVDFGILAEHQEERRTYAPQTASGELLRFQGIEIAETTDLIPLRSGLRFGIDYEFEDMPPGADIEVVVRHPPLAPPGSKPLTVSRLTMEPGNGFSYGFDHPYEQVPGTWTMEIHYDGRMLCSQSFRVVPDDG